MLKDKLEQSYKEKWIMRHNYDYIVILDQGTEDIEDDQKLIILRNALVQWDPTRNNNLKFLKGGYEDFNHLCPWETTQCNTSKPIQDTDSISDVELDPEPEYEKYESNRSLQIIMY